MQNDGKNKIGPKNSKADETKDENDESSAKDTSGIMTDSSLGSDGNEENNNLDSNTILFKIKFNELSNVFEMVS